MKTIEDPPSHIPAGVRILSGLGEKLPYWHAKSGLISVAARLALGQHLKELERICSTQKTISTDKLSVLIDRVSSKLKYESVHVRNIAMKL